MARTNKTSFNPSTDVSTNEFSGYDFDTMGVDHRKHRSTEYAEKAGYATFSGLPEVQAYPRTDIIYPQVDLYIEGIQVPFESIQLNNAYGASPECIIQIPYFSGLQEICRGYFPKVHIFFRDSVFEKYILGLKDSPDYELSDIRRLMFSGVIVGTQYAKNRSSNGDQVYITFTCAHKYYVLKEILVKFGARGVEQVKETAQEQAATAKTTSFNSDHAMVQVLAGIKTKSESTDTPVVPEAKENGVVNHLQKDLAKYSSRFVGVPGMMVALWNLLKRDSFTFPEYAKTMSMIYIPLIDSGLKVFRRFSGHTSIEAILDQERLSASNSELSRKAKESGEDKTQDQSDRGSFGDGGSSDILVPPAFKNFVGDAVAVDLGLLMMKSGLQNSNEMIDFISLCGNFFKSIRYDIETLASPVQSPKRDMEAVDLIIKPLLPFYYAPVCNVLLPHMFGSVTINDSSYFTPTRVAANVNPMAAAGGQEAATLTYRAPEDVRTVTSFSNPITQSNLSSSLIKPGEYPAPHEYARGVKLKAVGLEPWIVHLMQSNHSQTLSGFSSSGGNVSITGTDGSGGKTTVIPGLKPGTIAYKENARLIDITKSQLENMNDETRVWKYWDKNKKIPVYIADASARGRDTAIGSNGEVTDPIIKNLITSFRTATKVPKFWNVSYNPGNDSYLVYPPHYDYVGDVFFQTVEIEKALKANGGKSPYNTLSAPQSQSTNGAYDPTEKTTQAPAPTGFLAKPVLGNNEDLSGSTIGDTLDQQSRNYVTLDGKKPTIQSTESTPENPATLSGLINSWNEANPETPTMNPYDTSVNGIQAFQISIFSTMDYEYAMSLVETRTGSVDCAFNPFIIPGYPMDIIEASPERPSIHAFCTSVSHTIRSDGISTAVSFVSAMTYDEMRAYELPAILPWFQMNLGMVDKLSLINQTEDAKKKANEYYMKVLGVGYADPSFLENPVTGSSNSFLIDKLGNLAEDSNNIFMNSGSSGISDQFSNSINPNASYEGNLSLIRREIETMSDIEVFNGIKFVDIMDRVTLSSTVATQVSPLYQEILQKPGRSIFINYEREEQRLRELVKKGTTATQATQSAK